ncbi:MAG TPA: hypothetical protein VII69_09365 [Candidatus Eremiobacteraceae bacterium]
MIYVQVLLLGIAAGLRTLVAPAAVMLFFQLPGAWVAAVLALFEMYGDKSPKAPPRTAAPALAARLLFGALCGFALVYWGVRRPWSPPQLAWEAAVLGLVGALAGAFGGMYVRVELSRPGMFPALAVALAEDAVAIGLAFVAVTL